MKRAGTNLDSERLAARPDWFRRAALASPQPTKAAGSSAWAITKLRRELDHNALSGAWRRVSFVCRVMASYFEEHDCEPGSGPPETLHRQALLELARWADPPPPGSRAWGEQWGGRVMAREAAGLSAHCGLFSRPLYAFSSGLRSGAELEIPAWIFRNHHFSPDYRDSFPWKMWLVWRVDSGAAPH